MDKYVNLSDINLSVDKKNPSCGEVLTYTLAVSNSGNTDANDVILVNTIPKGLAFIKDSIYINGVNITGESLSDNIINIGTIPAGDTLTVAYKMKVDCVEEIIDKPETGPYVETATIYKKTSLKRSDIDEAKRFSMLIHTFEPLGIEVLKATDVKVLVQGTNLIGNADIIVHNLDNLKKIDTITSGISKIVTIPSKGELFLDISNLQYSTDNNTPFSFTVTLTFQDKTSYKITPTFDMRVNKISNKVINDVNEFKIKAKEYPNDGMLIISDNIRIYMPVAQHVPINFEPINTLNLHEDIVKTYDAMVGLVESNSQIINRPRRYFYLNTPRNENIGYMSAGGTCIDAEIVDSFLFFEPNWGLFHEYGHLYDISVGFLERSNNLFSKIMAEKTIGFTWLWGNDRSSFENTKILPIYQNYVNDTIVDIENVSKDDKFKQGLYMLIGFTEGLSNFVKTFWSYHRNTTDNKYLGIKEADAHAYSIASNYSVNCIPYFEMYGYKFEDSDVIDYVVNNSTSSNMFIPINSGFDTFRNLSVKPIVKGVYEGTNSNLSGVANPNAIINVYVNSNSYNTVANAQSKFTITIPDTINISTVVTVTSMEVGKQLSPKRVIKVKNQLADNKIEFLGIGDWFAASVKFDIYNNQLVVKSSSSNPHYIFVGQVYYGLYLYDVNDNLKASAEVNGDASSTSFATALNGKPFSNGDYIKLFHKEPSSRLRIYGQVSNAPKDLSIGFGTVSLGGVKIMINNSKLSFSLI